MRRPPVPPPPVPKRHKNLAGQKHKTYERMERFIKEQPYVLRNGWVTGFGLVVLLSLVPLLVALALVNAVDTDYAMIVAAIICTVIVLSQSSTYKKVVKNDCERSEALKLYHTIARKLGYEPKGSFFNILWFKIKKINREIEAVYWYKPLEEAIDDYEEFFDPNYVRKVKPEEIDAEEQDTAEKCIHEMNDDEKTGYDDDLTPFGKSWYKPPQSDNFVQEIHKTVNTARDELNDIKRELQDMAHEINGQSKRQREYSPYLEFLHNMRNSDNHKVVDKIIDGYNNCVKSVDQSDFDETFKKLETKIIDTVNHTIDDKYLTAKYKTLKTADKMKLKSYEYDDWQQVKTMHNKLWKLWDNENFHG